MQEQNTEDSRNPKVNHKPGGKTRCVKVSLVLLLSLGVVFAALASSTLKAPKRAQWGLPRLAWYLQANQLKAEAYTFAAMCRYVMADDLAAPAVTPVMNRSVAEHTTLTPNKS